MKQLLVLLLSLCSASVFAQDVIVKKDGSTIVCRVVELNSSEIVYKKWSDLNGSSYVMDRSLASAINYENGKKVNLSEVENLYRPGNQNDGVQQYNDRALLALDGVYSRTPKKAKQLRTWGLIGGVAIGIAGGAIMLSAPSDEGYEEQMIAGGVVLGIGVIGGATLCIIAEKKRKEAQYLQTQSLFHQNFQLSNGSILSAGIDMLHDNMSHQHNLGLGLRYNF